MNTSIDIPELPVTKALLHRVSSGRDLSNLVSQSRRNKQSNSIASVRRSENNGSEASEALYMISSKRSKRQDRSLSLIDANSFQRMKVSFDEKSGSEASIVLEDTINEPTGDIIDREIFEWQWVCRTGRPFWWSPQSNYSRQTHSPTRLSNGHGPRVWISEMGDEQEPEYNTKRRAISDSVLAGPSTVDDFAQMVAIRLLGSCFTLPPDSVTGGPSLNCKITAKNGTSSYLDPRMVSCLRMQTHYRYSPCFGHQPRDTSPIRSRDSISDGAFPNTSAPDTGMHTPVISSSSRISRRTKGHRAPNVTEGSTGSLRNSSADEDPMVASTIWHHRQGVDDDPSNRISIPKTRKKVKGRAKKNSQDDQVGTWGTRVGEGSNQISNTHYALQPVIRSEPHHVFIQPVRELVVKRWNNIRRRFGGSLHSALPAGASEDQSQSSRSGASSPMMSSDGKERRRRARERGEISSYEETQHFNSPASGQLSSNESGTNSPFLVDSAKTTLGFTLANPLAAAAALASVEGHGNVPRDQGSLPEVDIPPPEHLPGPPDSPASPSSIPVRGASSQPVTCPPATSRNGRGARRKSQLSEVITADDLVEEPNIYIDHTISHGSPTNRPSSILTSTMEESELPITRPANKAPGDYFGRKRTPTGTQERPRFLRMNTSGTQIFSTNDEGVEVDGLPAGPPKETWQGTDRKEEKSLL